MTLLAHKGEAKQPHKRFQGLGFTNDRMNIMFYLVQDLSTSRRVKIVKMVTMILSLTSMIAQQRQDSLADRAL